MKAAFAQGSLCVHGQLPKQLAPFRLGGRAAAVDLALLGQIVTEPGPRWLGAMVDRALESTSLVLVAARDRERLIAGLINALPVECRTAFSFSTGLKHSPRRPFRLIGLADTAGDTSQVLRRPNVSVFELSDGPADALLVEGSWGSLVARMLETSRLAYFSAQLAQPRPGLQAGDLAALATEIYERMPAPARSTAAARIAGASPAETTSQSAVRGGETSAKPYDAIEETVTDGSDVRLPPDQRRADAAHLRLWRAVAEAATPTAAGPRAGKSPSAAPPDTPPESPSQALSWQCPEIVEKLELLDDLVFEAIAGKPSALGQLRALLAHGAGRDSAHLVGRVARALHSARVARVARVRRWRPNSQSGARGHGDGRRVLAV